MEEIRIDCANQSEEEILRAKNLWQLVFRLNHTMPMTDEYDRIVKEVFPNIGEGVMIQTPITVVRSHMVKFEIE